MADSHQQCHLTIDSDWGTHVCSKNSTRHPGDGYVCLHGGRQSVHEKERFPHRLVLRTILDVESILPDARKAAEAIMIAYEAYRNSKPKRSVRPRAAVLTAAIQEAFGRIRDGVGACCDVGAASQDPSFWDIPSSSTFHSVFEQDQIAVARLKMVNSLVVRSDADGCPGFVTDAARRHFECLQYEARPGAVAGQEPNMTIRVGDVVSVQLDSRCAYSFTGTQHDLWVVKEIFLDRNDRLRLDCQVLVHPGDHDGHLRGHGQSSFESLEHKPWPLRLFRERTVDVAKEMAGAHARTLAAKNARAMLVRHRRHSAQQYCTSEALLAYADVPTPPARVHVSELSMPKNLALARHGRVSDARELFLLSDAAQARMRTIIGMEHIRSVVRDVQFLRHDEAPPAHGNMYCKFMQHAWDWKYTDLLPPKVPRYDHNEVEKRPLKLFAGAGGLDHAAPEPGWTVDMCASACLTIKANKPGEEVYHMGVEEFNAMCCSMDHLEAQLRSDSSEQLQSRVRDMAECAAYSEVKGQASSLKPYLRDAPHENSSDKTQFQHNNDQAVQAVLEMAREMGSFRERHSKRVPTKAEFQGKEKAFLMQAIRDVAGDMRSEHAAEHKAEIEVLHLDKLFIDVYLPYFMQVYSQAFASAFVSGLQDVEPGTPAAAESSYNTWELTLACVVHLTQSQASGCIPRLHAAVCRAVARPPRPSDHGTPTAEDDTPQARAGTINDIVDFRMADAAQRFTEKSKGFLVQKLMRAETQLFFCCKIGDSSEWLNTNAIIARGGQVKLLHFIECLRADRRLPWPGGVSAILAGPPCQDISGANPHSSKCNVMDTDQVRNNMVFPLLDAIEWFKPSYVVIEQVPVALSTDKRAYATTLQHQLLTLGYQTHVRLINSEDCGAPQKRLRMFVLAAARGRLLPQFPSPTEPIRRTVSVAAQGHQQAVLDRHPYVDLTAPGNVTTSPGPSTRTGVAEDVGDHQACMWDVVSDLPHVDNGGFLGMLSADAISSPRSVFQHYNARTRRHGTGLPSRLCMVLGAGPYVIMSARLLLLMNLSDEEIDAASKLLAALRARQMVPDRFEQVLGQKVSGDAICSLQCKVHLSVGLMASTTSTVEYRRTDDVGKTTKHRIATSSSRKCEDAMNCLAMLARQAVAERNFCALLCSIASSCPSAQVAEPTLAVNVLHVLQRQICQLKAVADRALDEVRQMDSEDSAMAVAEWRDHNLRGPDGTMRRWACADRLQRVILTPAVHHMRMEVAKALQAVDDAVGTACTARPALEQMWVLNHVPVRLSMHNESMIGTVLPWRHDFRSLDSLAESRKACSAMDSSRTAPHKSCMQLLVSGRPARTDAFLKGANSYQRPHLHSVPSTVTTSARVQVNCTDSHPVLNRTLSVLELKRCQGFPDDYALLAFPDAVEDHHSGALKVESSECVQQSCSEGGSARNEGPPISLKRGFSTLLRLAEQERSIWSMHTSQTKNLWRLVGNAVCVLVARQLRVSLQAAVQIGMRQVHSAMPDPPVNDSGPMFTLTQISPAISDKPTFGSCHVETHHEWQMAVELHLATPRGPASRACGQGRAIEPLLSLLRNAYGRHLPDFLQAALHEPAYGCAGAVTARPDGDTSGASMCYQLPYGLAWDGPEVERLAQIWRSKPQPSQRQPAQHYRRLDVRAPQAKRKHGHCRSPGRGGALGARSHVTLMSDSEAWSGSTTTSNQMSDNSSDRIPAAGSGSDLTPSEIESGTPATSSGSGPRSACKGAAAQARARAPSAAVHLHSSVPRFFEVSRRSPRITTAAGLDNSPDFPLKALEGPSPTKKRGQSQGWYRERDCVRNAAMACIDLTAFSSGEEEPHGVAASLAPFPPPAANPSVADRAIPSGDVPFKRFQLHPVASLNHKQRRPSGAMLSFIDPVEFPRFRISHVPGEEAIDVGENNEGEVDFVSPAQSKEWLPKQRMSGADSDPEIVQIEGGSCGMTCSWDGHCQEDSWNAAAQPGGNAVQVQFEREENGERPQPSLQVDKPQASISMSNTVGADEEVAQSEGDGQHHAAMDTRGGSDLHDSYGYSSGFGKGNEYVGEFALHSD